MQAGRPTAIAAGACSTTTDQAKASPSRAGRTAGVAAPTGDDPDSHRTEHPLHAWPRMVNADRLDPVIPQEPCHPGMMSTLGPLIVEVPQATVNSGQSRISPPAPRRPRRGPIALSASRPGHPR